VVPSSFLRLEMDEESSEPREVHESLQEVKAELARKRLGLLLEEVAELKAQINSCKGSFFFFFKLITSQASCV